MAAAQPSWHEARREHVAPALSITTQISYFLQLWGLKIASDLGFAVIRRIKPTPSKLRPTLVKVYPCRPSRRNRIFIPQSHEAGCLLPLYIDLHGGGFALCDAQFDDEFCGEFASTFNVLVVSIDYAKAPLNKYPGPTNDVVAIAQAIIEDRSLPIDTTRVVLGGFSAGGNLALSAGQSEVLGGKLKGIVSWYPVTDFTLSPKEKQRSRPYRHDKDTDPLKDFGPVFNWGYIPAGHNLKDPRVSVRYAGQKTLLPKWIFVIGAQYDMLANEARQMVFDIAGLSEEERQLGNDGFEKDSYKWAFVRGVRHGFTHEMGDCKGDDEITRKRRRQEMLTEVGKWLFDGPFYNGESVKTEGRSFEICRIMGAENVAAFNDV